MSLPAALTYQYTSADEIANLLSSSGVNSRINDNADDEILSDETDLVSINAVNYATSRVNLFLLTRYKAEKLVNSWQVHQWCATIAAVWLCQRRGNPCPESLLEAKQEAEAEMLSVRNHELDLMDIAERESDQICVVNSRRDARYTVKQMRRQRSLSDRRPSHIPPSLDYLGDAISTAEEGIR